MTRHITAIAALFLAGTAVSPTLAQDIKLPPSMAFTAYDTGTSGFNIAVGVGKMMKDKYGSDIRVSRTGITSVRHAWAASGVSSRRSHQRDTAGRSRAGRCASV